MKDLILEKAEIYMSEGCLEEAKGEFQLALAKTVAGPKRLEIHYSILLVLYKQGRIREFQKKLEECQKMSDCESDWERRTKLMVFQSINLILTRQIEQAAKLMLQLVSTFNAPEILPYDTFAYYACIFSILTLPRKEFNDKILLNPELIQVLNEDKILSNFIKNLYEAKYDRFFSSLLEL